MGQTIKQRQLKVLAKCDAAKAKQAAVVNPWLGVTDDTLTVFDNALSAAEEVLQGLLPAMSPARIAELFSVAVSIHLRTELQGAKKYGNSVADFRDAVNEGTESAF